MRIILILKILFLLFLNSLAAQSLGNYQFSLEGLYKLKHRASVILPESSFTFLEEYRYGKREYLHLNLSLPGILLGHLYPCGLLKEMDNPGNYTADSTVFKEEAFIREDTSFRKGSLKGLVLFPLSIGQIFLLQAQDNTPQVGAGFRIPLTHSMELELLFRFYGVGLTEEGYSRIKKSPFLLDLSDLNFFPFLNYIFTLEGKEPGFFFSLLFGSSLSRFTLPGGFLRFYGNLSLPKGKLTVAASLVTPGYLTVRTAREQGLFSLFTSLAVKPGPGLQILGRIGLPVELPWSYLEDFSSPPSMIMKPSGTLTFKTTNSLFKTSSSLSGKFVLKASEIDFLWEDYAWDARFSFAYKDLGEVSAAYSGGGGGEKGLRVQLSSQGSRGPVILKARAGVELGEPLSFYWLLSGEIGILEGRIRVILTSNGWIKREDLLSKLSSLKGITLEYKSGNLPFILEDHEE